MLSLSEKNLFLFELSTSLKRYMFFFSSLMFIIIFMPFRVYNGVLAVTAQNDKTLQLFTYIH